MKSSDCTPSQLCKCKVPGVDKDEVEDEDKVTMTTCCCAECGGEEGPWVGVDGAVSFITSSLEEYATAVTTTRQEQQQQQRRRIRRHNSTTMETIVIATHACGALTDKVLHFASTINASSIAVMPCCYTGTAEGAPYGVKRMLGVSLAADMRRSFALQECGNYHVDFASIPKSITPMNRIIVAERRK